MAYYDPLKDLSKQFFTLMRGNHTAPFDDVYDKSTKKWTFVQDRYHAGNRNYQMQIDFMYLLKNVRESGRNQSVVKKAQSFIDQCAIELRNK